MAANGTRARTSGTHTRRISSSSTNTSTNRTDGNGASSGGSSIGTELVVPALVEELSTTVDGATKRLAALTDEVRGIADRLLGSDGTGQAGMEEPTVTGQAYAAMQSVRFLLGAITVLESEVRRLHRL
jgi:hypothetical protein